LLDEAASGLRLQQESKPEELENLDRKIQTILIELEALKNETSENSKERKEKLHQELKEKKMESENLTSKWKDQRNKIEKIKKIKIDIEKKRQELEENQRRGNYTEAGRLMYVDIPSLEKQLPNENETENESEGLLLNEYVTDVEISKIVSRITGIPVSNLRLSEKEKLLNMEVELKKSIVGQDQAVNSISNAIRISRAGLSSSTRPIGR
jgi:ATP-dependent Clp protease ATP-binding subunit ClpB